MHRGVGKSIAVILGVSILAGQAGCSAVRGPSRAGRAPADRAAVLRPGKLGGAADGRRVFFDFWNESLIREDVKVGTVFMGDSITELWSLSAYFVASDGTIENRGISGDMARAMAKRFEADVVQLRPRNVVILAGTNDVRELTDAGKGDEEIVNTVVEAVLSMMDQARAAEITTFVCSILPTNSDWNRHANRTGLRAVINDKVKSACAARGCTYVDYAAKMSDGNLRKDLANDGLHPHYAGYAIMRDCLLEAARKQGVRF